MQLLNSQRQYINRVAPIYLESVREFLKDNAMPETFIVIKRFKVKNWQPYIIKTEEELIREYKD